LGQRGPKYKWLDVLCYGVNVLNFMACLSNDFFPLSLNSGLGRLIIEISRSHTLDTRAHISEGSFKRVIRLSQRVLPKQHNKHKRRTSISSGGFGPAIPAINRPYTYVLDRTVIRICLIYDTTL